MFANRPLSPHLQVYRLPITGLMSIGHRIAGVMLSLGLVLVTYLLYSIAAGEAAYQTMQAFMRHPVCQLIYWGFIYALSFHLCHGVRHLIWDVGKLLDRSSLTIYAVFELTASISLTLIVYFLS
ncbi:MAG: succinate dehydrogenase, cytochrome b556 subunit [Gammaproteobacteria bacterium]